MDEMNQEDFLKKEEVFSDESDDLYCEDPDDLINSWLSELSPGSTLVVNRLEPAFARGWLEEIPITDNERPIDLEGIRNRWGGHKLSLRVRKPAGSTGKRGGTLGKSHVVELYSFEPLRYGRPVRWNSQKNPFLDGDDNKDQVTVSPVQIPPPQQPHNDIIAQILASQQALLMQMMSQKAEPVPTRKEKTPAFEQLGEAVQLVKMIQAMTPTASLASSTGGDLDGLSAFLPIISSLLGKGSGSDKPKLSARSNPTAVSSNEKSMAQQIASLGPDGAARACAEILANIPDDQREQAVDSFFNHAKISLNDEFEDDEQSTDDEQTDDNQN